MNRNRLVTTLASLTFLAPLAASAAVVFNEVEIAPTDARFIELYNTGSTDVDMTGWYIQRKTATGSSFGSLVTSTKFEGKSIKSGGYFLISRTPLANTDIVADTLTLTESNTLRLRDSNGADVDQIEWGSVDAGKSYQKSTAGWTIGTPTPGAANVSQGDGGGNTSSGTGTIEATSTQNTPVQVNSSWLVDPQIFADAGPAERTVIVGADAAFSGRLWGLKKEPIENGRMQWSFGDGGSGEGYAVAHHYRYPGTYIVMLTGSSGYYSGTDRMVVRAAPAQLSISKIATGTNGFIELSNAGTQEVDLSGWFIRAATTTFEFPQNTIVGAHTAVSFPQETTGIVLAGGETVALLYPNGTVAATYDRASAVAPIARISAPPSRAAGRRGSSSATSTTSSAASANIALAAGGTAEDASGTMALWVMGVLLGALGVVGATVAIRRRMLTMRPVSVADEAAQYEIVEESEDDKIPF